MKFRFPLILTSVFALGSLVGGGFSFAADEILAYKFNLVTAHVHRGTDENVAAFAGQGKDQGSFNLAPSWHPTATFFGENGFAMGVMGSLALMHRERDDGDPAVVEADLGAIDELDFTLSQGWKNRLGEFKAGYMLYSFVNPRGGPNEDELFISWVFPFLPAFEPTITHYAATSTQDHYSSFAIGSGEKLKWGATVGLGKKNVLDASSEVMVTGIKDFTLEGGYRFGSFSISLGIAHRPNLKMHDLDGTADGKFLSPVSGSLSDMPSTLYWMTFGYGGSVRK